jgi:hypothetical protein
MAKSEAVRPSKGPRHLFGKLLGAAGVVANLHEVEGPHRAHHKGVLMQMSSFI